MKCSMGLLGVSTAALVTALLVSGNHVAGKGRGSILCHSRISDDVAEDNLLLQAFLPEPGLSRASKDYSYGCRSENHHPGLLQLPLIDEDEDFTEIGPINRDQLLEPDSEPNTLTASLFSVPDVLSRSKSRWVSSREPIVDLKSHISDDAVLVARASPPTSPRSPSPPPSAKRKKPAESPPLAPAGVARLQQQTSPHHEQAALKGQPRNTEASASPAQPQSGPSVAGYRSQLQQIHQPDADEIAAARLMQQLGVPRNGVGSQARQTLVRAIENNRLRPELPQTNSRGRQQTVATNSPSSSTTTSSNQRRSLEGVQHRSMIVNGNGYRSLLQSARISGALSKASVRSKDHGLLPGTSLQSSKPLQDNFRDLDSGFQKRSILLPRTQTGSGQGSTSPFSSMAENESQQYSGQRSSMGSISAPVSRVGSPNPPRLGIEPQFLQQQPISESPRLDRIQSLPSNSNPVYNANPPIRNQRSNTLQFLVDLARSNRAPRGPVQPFQPQFRPGLGSPFQTVRPATHFRAIPPHPSVNVDHNPFAQISSPQRQRAHSAELFQHRSPAAQAGVSGWNRNAGPEERTGPARWMSDAASARMVRSRLASDQIGPDGRNSPGQGPRLSVRINRPNDRDAAGNQQPQQSGPPTTPPAVTPRRQRSPPYRPGQPKPRK